MSTKPDYISPNPNPCPNCADLAGDLQDTIGRLNVASDERARAQHALREAEARARRAEKELEHWRKWAELYDDTPDEPTENDNQRRARVNWWIEAHTKAARQAGYEVCAAKVREPLMRLHAWYEGTPQRLPHDALRLLDAIAGAIGPAHTSKGPGPAAFEMHWHCPNMGDLVEFVASREAADVHARDHGIKRFLFGPRGGPCYATEPTEAAPKGGTPDAEHDDNCLCDGCNPQWSEPPAAPMPEPDDEPCSDCGGQGGSMFGPPCGSCFGHGSIDAAKRAFAAPAAAAPQGAGPWPENALVEMWRRRVGRVLDEWADAIGHPRGADWAELRKATRERLAAPSAPQGGAADEAAADEAAADFHQDVGIAGFAEALGHTLRHYGFEEPQHHDVAVEELLTELWRLAKAYPYRAASPPQGEPVVLFDEDGAATAVVTPPAYVPKVGDRVEAWRAFTDDEAEAIGWAAHMQRFVGHVGTVEAVGEHGDAFVRFADHGDGYTGWWWHRGALRPTSDEPGEAVGHG